MTAVDPLEFRKFAGHFATGIAVITALKPDGAPVGFTANSLTSLSLNPPLYLVCVTRDSDTLPVLLGAGCFGISLLSEAQQEVSSQFAGKGGAEKFSALPVESSPLGIPWLVGSVGHAECVVSAVYEGGDHVIVVGEVTSVKHAEGNPLLYFRGAYAALSNS